jgi:hypothetical protein
MAFCPECGGTMGQTETVCPQCGYDFPEAGPGKLARLKRAGWIYSPIADGVLVVGQIVMGLCGLLSLLGWIVSLAYAPRWESVVAGPIMVLFFLATVIVFARVREM